MCNIRQINITKESIDEMYDLEPKRICFSTTHKNSLVREEGEYIGKFSIPFADSIYPIFQEMTDIDLFPSKYSDSGLWRSIRCIDEYDIIENFINEVYELVFLRDTLALSIALSINIGEDDKRTEIGNLEYRAKYLNDNNATVKIANHCIHICNKLPYYKNTINYCAVPSGKSGEKNLPNRVVKIMENKIEINNISDKLYWGK